jgi:hypothetical protein
MPDVDTGALAWLAGAAVDHAQIDPERDARAAFRDFRANQPGIQIKRPLDRLRRQETDIAKCIDIGTPRVRPPGQRSQRGNRESRERRTARKRWGLRHLPLLDREFTCQASLQTEA